MIAAFADATGPKLALELPLSRRLLLRAAGAPPTLMMRTLAGAGPRLLRLGKRGG
jgi:hypothetical protein